MHLVVTQIQGEVLELNFYMAKFCWIDPWIWISSVIQGQLSSTVLAHAFGSDPVILCEGQALELYFTR